MSAQTYILLALLLADVALLAWGALLPGILLTIALSAAAGFIGLRRSVWYLRSRLMITYVFVGAVPVLLILALAYCGTWALTGQVAEYLITSELQRRTVSLEGPARFLADIPSDRLPTLSAQFTSFFAARNPGFQVIVTGTDSFRYPDNRDVPDPPAGWRDFTGLLERDHHYYTVSSVGSGNRRATLVVPLTSQSVEALAPGIGALKLASYHLAGEVPPPQNLLDFEFPWYNDIDVAMWDDPAVHRKVRLSIATRPSAVLAAVFAGQGSVVYDALLIIAGLFAVVELLAIVAGVSLTRTITGAVHHLYAGTEQIAHGDFSHRIPVNGNDQLAELGTSFNQMTEQLEKLVVVAKEKERLQSELAIASEVQNQLFPRKPPPMRTVQLIGACEPARTVSGDYYDYLCMPNGNLAFAIGDVAGKGISAALLMASIQSIMRTQLTGGMPTPSRLVAQLNRQLHETTSSEKYATFFFGLYDETTRVLRYTNAGHVPPLVICGETVKSLDTNGTVVGLFASAPYQEDSIELHHDDLLIAYTDGVTEPENAYGEEYGAERLAEVVIRNRTCEPAEIVARVMESVKHWSHSAEMPDDLTVLIARGIA